MGSMLVIGAGNFGANLAIKLESLKNEVMVIDSNEDAVDKITSQVTRTQIGNCMDRDIMNELGVRNFDVCFVCISENFQSSMEITSLLKELGAKYIVSKTDSDKQAELLIKIGADEVVYPERDMAMRTAAKFSVHGAFDYIELSPEYAILEIAAPQSWVNLSVKSLDIRSKSGINVIGIKENNKITPIVSPDYIFANGDHVIVAGNKKDILSMKGNT
jgi:trk system potassium uptake protein TrkA